MATQYITLADGTRIPVQNTGDVDSGSNYDYEGALNQAGYLTLAPNEDMSWLNEHYGLNMTPEQYREWIYGPGGNYTTSDYGNLYKPPNGIDQTVNTPLEYYDNSFDFGDAVLMGITSLAGAGLTGMLPGTTNVFGGLGGALSGGENVLSGMDLSGYMTGVDDYGLSTLTSGAEGAGAATGAASGYSMPPPMTPPGPPMDPNWATPLSGSSGFDWSSLMPNGGSLANTLLGKALPAALGAYGASQQADAYRDMMNKYYGMGEPFRNLLNQSYQPGFDLNKEPGFQNAMDTGLNTWLRAASAGRASGVSRGNPLDEQNRGATIEGQKYITGSLALPYLTNYRSGLTAAGQLGLGPSAQFGDSSIKSQGGVYDALGYGLGEIFNPKPNYGINFDPQSGQYKMGSI
jgi:hypothetical protein